MPARTCWSCHAYSETRLLPEAIVSRPLKPEDGGVSPKLAYGAYYCMQCGAMSIGRSGLHYHEDPRQALNQGPQEWLPEHATSKDFPEVPEHIAAAATEATKCLSLGCYRAAGSLARAVVEATAKEKGITSGVLQVKIDELANQGHIRKDVQEAAHEIRHFGNGMAHGDFVEPVTEEDAEEVVGLMEELLDEVFQAPARLAARKAKRLAARAAIQEAQG